jgi:hypothetical protein
MEKIIYALWKDPAQSREAFHDSLKKAVSDQLLKAGARGLRLNLPDATVEPAAPLKQINTFTTYDAVVQLWVKVSHGEFRKPFDDILKAACQRMQSWLVLESEVIPNEKYPVKEGERTYGWSQVVFLTKPDRLTHEAWRDIWQGSHTRVAIDVQANFLYTQNLVVRPLAYGSAPLAAIVEECFLPEGMTSADAFFGGGGDPKELAYREKAMADSCARFIDFDKLDVVPTSQFEMKIPSAR